MRPRAILGKLSLVVFLVGVAAFICLFVAALRIGGEEGIFGDGGLAMLIAWWCSITSLFLAAGGLLRRERPNWPSIIGVSLSIAPTAVGFYLYLAGR